LGWAGLLGLTLNRDGVVNGLRGRVGV